MDLHLRQQRLVAIDLRLAEVGSHLGNEIAGLARREADLVFKRPRHLFDDLARPARKIEPRRLSQPE